MHAIVLASVDLPAPLSPTRAVTCPGWMARSTSCSTCTAPKLLLMPRSSSSGSPCLAAGREASPPGEFGAGTADSVMTSPSMYQDASCHQGGPGAESSAPEPPLVSASGDAVLGAQLGVGAG